MLFIKVYVDRDFFNKVYVVVVFNMVCRKRTLTNMILKKVIKI